MTATLEVDIELRCDCGYPLDYDIVSRYGTNFVKVTPCPKCLEQAKEDSREESCNTSAE
jgi:hypothetical protein